LWNIQVVKSAVKQLKEW